MHRISLYHNSHLPRYRFPFGAAPCGTTVAFSLDVTGLPADCVCTLRIWFGDVGETLVPMSVIGETGASGGGAVCRRYACTYTTPDAPGNIWYYFIAASSGVTRYYGNNEQSRGGEGKEAFSPPPSYQLTVYADNPVPVWWKEGLVYQIFVDRFARGSDWKERFFDAQHADDRRGPTRILQSDWRDAPFLYKDDRGWIVRWPFFGGTLTGIREKLSYLKSLGVTILYLNPIFEAASNHKYDTADYMKIDPGFGDEASFRLLAKEARDCGISIILDGVFSHTGADSIYFNKYGNYPSLGAWQSKDSPYRSWYRFNHDKEGYECWWGVADLPNVEETNPSYRAFIFGDDDSVVRHWIKAGARGWRLDVADELPDEFICEIRKAMKETDPGSVLLGEVWEDASNKTSYGVMRQYLLGMELDSTMNYPFRDWSLDFALGRIAPAEVHARVMSLYENYPREYFFSCLNLIGSHDKPRVLSVLGEAPIGAEHSDWQKQSYRMDEAQRDLAKRRLTLLSAWQMTFPGVPSVFYGDEAGAEGFDDPHNRIPFPWGREDWEILERYRQLGNLRAEYDLFRKGEFVSCGGYRHIYAFGRHGGRERAVVLLNASRDESEEAPIALSRDETVFVELLSGSVLTPEHADASASETAVRDETPFWAGGDPDSWGGRAPDLLRVRVGPLESKIVYIRKADPASLVMKSLPRAAGVLCHITSLPSETGCGDFGKAAYDFCDYLASAGQRIWQLLPITAAGGGNSPYSGASAFAGNELLIDTDDLVKTGLLAEGELPKQNLTARVLQSLVTGGSGNRADFARARAHKLPLLEKAFAAFDREDPAFADFCNKNAAWLPDYCLHRAISEARDGEPWQEWPKALRDRDPQELARHRKQLARPIVFHAFLQYIFMKQWGALKAYAAKRGISILGDLPIYVSASSCDTWAHRSIFDLDENGRMRKSGGVPPDAFTEDGQNWNNPVFLWEANGRQGYSWWIERFRRNLQLYDFLRLDHFRGFEACWEIPANAKTAREGNWRKGPGKALFEAVEAALGPLPMLAEDLGVITPSVNALRNTFAWPGMKVYQFHADEMEAAARATREGDPERGADKETAQDGGAAEKPSDDAFLQVFYTGTHDNDTLASWVSERLRAADRTAGTPQRPKAEAGAGTKTEAGAGAEAAFDRRVKETCTTVIETLYAAPAMWTILPLQDVWFLGADARMNTPGVPEGNWVWTASADAFTPESAAWLRGLAEKHGRTG
ncbi:MAG: 4-alpha-glucanotransferase [Clostridiales Family XIII bacterium]|jgi:4-alpha-glucanotransferase|nr:4-alpha-glucanotransferase [Clostridiales Family XIII bacterium]